MMNSEITMKQLQQDGKNLGSVSDSFAMKYRLKLLQDKLPGQALPNFVSTFRGQTPVVHQSKLYYCLLDRCLSLYLQYSRSFHDES